MLKNKKCQMLLIAASAFIGINGNVYGSNLGKPYPTRIDGDGRVMKDPLAMVNRQAAYRGSYQYSQSVTYSSNTASDNKSSTHEETTVRHSIMTDRDGHIIPANYD